MNWKYKITFLPLVLILSMGVNSCDQRPDSDQKQTAQQEKLLQEGTAQSGMPAITHFAERKLLKQVLELRDDPNFLTYTYLFVPMTGKFVPFCDSIGYPLPYSTQYTSPQKDIFTTTSSASHMAMPQADPNGLFSPAAAEGTWVLCVDPNGKDKDLKPVYVEDRVQAWPWRLPESRLQK